MKKKLLILLWSEGYVNFPKTSPFIVEVDEKDPDWLSDKYLKALLQTLGTKGPVIIEGVCFREIYSFNLDELPVHRFINVPAWVKV